MAMPETCTEHGQTRREAQAKQHRTKLRGRRESIGSAQGFVSFVTLSCPQECLTLKERELSLYFSQSLSEQGARGGAEIEFSIQLFQRLNFTGEQACWR